MMDSLFFFWITNNVFLPLTMLHIQTDADFVDMFFIYAKPCMPPILFSFLIIIERKKDFLSIIHCSTYVCNMYVFQKIYLIL